MKLKVIGTGSTGNAYLLETVDETLMIECGVNSALIIQALNFDLHKVVGCIITHEHNDHSKSIFDIMKWGIEVYATEGTLKAKKAELSANSHAIRKNEKFNVGGFTIMAFKTIHDAADPVGYLIQHKECGLTLFLTDTAYVEYQFPGLNNLIIEANYDMKIIREKMGPDSELKFLKNRILTSHFNIDNCIEFLNVNDLTAVNNIVLIHLSDGNSNEADFRKRVQDATGKTVHVADNGMEIDFNSTPF
ncbi:MAG: MBL fold metallo-hydrolase [Moheibacter sp.]